MFVVVAKVELEIAVFFPIEWQNAIAFHPRF